MTEEQTIFTCCAPMCEAELKRIWDKPAVSFKGRGFYSTGGQVPYYLDSEKERRKRWQCFYCEKIYVVPDLARGCEAKHEAEEQKWDFINHHILKKHMQKALTVLHLLALSAVKNGLLKEPNFNASLGITDQQQNSFAALSTS